jgi:DNA-binding PucR family transcriptional regulator
MERVSTLTGRRLDDMNDIVELWLALRAASILG